MHEPNRPSLVKHERSFSFMKLLLSRTFWYVLWSSPTSPAAIDRHITSLLRHTDMIQFELEMNPIPKNNMIQNNNGFVLMSFLGKQFIIFLFPLQLKH